MLKLWTIECKQCHVMQAADVNTRAPENGGHVVELWNYESATLTPEHSPSVGNKNIF